MYSKNHKPNSSQRRWHQWLARQTCVMCGDMGVQLHHAAGASAKHDKVHIGQWWLIPVCPWCHGYVAASKNRKIIEKQTFGDLWADYEQETGNTIPQHVVTAIQEYHR